MADTERPENSPKEQKPNGQENLVPRLSKLPEDIDALARMRDQLAEYLSTLENNTEKLSEWMNENKETIVLGYHRLHRSIVREKNEQSALAEIARLGASAGFVLSIDDFATLATASFGVNSKVVTEIKKFNSPYPSGVLDPLPEVNDNNANYLSPDVPEAPELEKPKKVEPATGFWSGVKNVFRDEAAELREAQEKLEAQRAKWRQVRDEMIGLTSDKHYYIDSFMDYIGDALSEETPENTDTELMLSYKHPQYIIDRAREDFDAVNLQKSQGIRSLAADYAQIADLFAAPPSERELFWTMEFLHSGLNDSREEFMRRLLFKDLGVASFAEYALTKIDDPQMQSSALNKAIALEKKITLSKITGVADVFKTIFDRVIDTKKPLDSSVLVSLQSALNMTALTDFDKNKINLSDCMNKIEGRYGQTPQQHLSVLNDLLKPSFNGKDLMNTLSPFVSLRHGCAINNSDMVLSVLETSNPGSIKAVKSLWYLQDPDGERTILDAVSDLMLSTTKQAANNILASALKSDCLDELHLKKTSSSAQVDKALDFFHNHMISGRITLDNARRFMSYTLANSGTVEWREKLTGSARSAGWISTTIERPDLNIQEKLEWVGLMLHPLGNNFARANTLAVAKSLATQRTTQQTIDAMMRSLYGDNIELENSLITNVDNIVHIWADRDAKTGLNTLRYTNNSTTHVAAEKLSDADTKEILTFIVNRGGFIPEHNGAIKPEKIDEFLFKNRTIIKSGKSENARTEEKEITYSQGKSENIKVNAGFDSHTAARIRNQSGFYGLSNTQKVEKDIKGGAKEINEDETMHNIESFALIGELESDRTLIIEKSGALQSDVKGTIDVDISNDHIIKVGRKNFLNIQNVHSLIIDEAKRKVSFRVESEKFDQSMQAIDPDNPKSFFEFTTSADAIRNLKKAISADPLYTSYVDDNNVQHYHNFRYMIAISYQSNRNSPALKAVIQYNKNEVNLPTSANTRLRSNFFDDMCRNPNLVVLGNFLLNPEQVYHVRYNAIDNIVQMVTSAVSIQIDISSARHKSLFVNTLAQKFGFVHGESNGRTGDFELINPRQITNISEDISTTNYGFTTRQHIKRTITSGNTSFETDMTENAIAPMINAFKMAGKNNATPEAVLRTLVDQPLPMRSMAQNMVEPETIDELAKNIDKTAHDNTSAADREGLENLSNLRNLFNQSVEIAARNIEAKTSPTTPRTTKTKYPGL